MKSGTLEDFGFAYTLQSIIEVFLVASIPVLTVLWGGIKVGMVLNIIGIVLLFICNRWFSKSID